MNWIYQKTLISTTKSYFSDSKNLLRVYKKNSRTRPKKISVASFLYYSWFSKNPVAKQYTSKLIVVSMLHILLILILHWRRSGVFIVNFEHISHVALVFLLSTLNMQLPAGTWIWKQGLKGNEFQRAVQISF